jgi:DNA-directed RNA polymerase specialized sigma24 family protein
LLTKEQQQLVVDTIPHAKRMAHAHVRRWQHLRGEVEELEQVAYVALVQAAQGFDPKMGEFRPYASRAVCNCLIRASRNINTPFTFRGSYFDSTRQNAYAPLELTDPAAELNMRHVDPADTDQRDGERLMTQTRQHLTRVLARSKQRRKDVPNTAKRDTDVFLDVVLRGKTLQDAAVDHGINNRQRVEQIVNRVKPHYNRWVRTCQG